METISVEKLLEIMSLQCYKRLRCQHVLNMARTSPFAMVYVDSIPIRYRKKLDELHRNNKE